MANCDNCGRKIAFMEDKKNYKDNHGHRYVFCKECDASYKVTKARKDYEQKLIEHREELKELYSRAKKKIDHKEYDDALKAIERVLEIDPHDTEFQRKKAEILTIQKRYLKALRCYNLIPEKYAPANIRKIREELIVKVKEQIVEHPTAYVIKVVAFLVLMLLIALASYLIDVIGYVLPIWIGEFVSVLSKPFLFAACIPALLRALDIFVNKQSKWSLGVIAAFALVISYIFVPLVPKFIAPMYVFSLYEFIAGNPTAQTIGLVLVAITSISLPFFTNYLGNDEEPSPHPMTEIIKR